MKIYIYNEVKYHWGAEKEEITLAELKDVFNSLSKYGHCEIVEISTEAIVYRAWEE